VLSKFDRKPRSTKDRFKTTPTVRRSPRAVSGSASPRTREAESAEGWGQIEDANECLGRLESSAKLLP